MSVNYTHETPFGTHQVLEESSDVVLDLTGKTVKFYIKPTDNGPTVETVCPLMGTGSPYLFEQDSIYGCLFVDDDAAIAGRIVRTHALVGEDDTGTFSGTHNQ